MRVIMDGPQKIYVVSNVLQKLQKSIKLLEKSFKKISQNPWLKKIRNIIFLIINIRIKKENNFVNFVNGFTFL